MYQFPIPTIHVKQNQVLSKRYDASSKPCQDTPFFAQLPLLESLEMYQDGLKLSIQILQKIARSGVFPRAGSTATGAVIIPVGELGRYKVYSFNIGDSKTIITSESSETPLHQTKLHTIEEDISQLRTNEFRLTIETSGIAQIEALKSFKARVPLEKLSYYRPTIDRFNPKHSFLDFTFKEDTSIEDRVAIFKEIQSIQWAHEGSFFPSFKVRLPDGLAMSRSIGDLNQRGLLLEADFSSCEFDARGQTVHIVAASDGLYDVCDHEEIMRHLNSPPVDAKSIVDRAFESWRAKEYSHSDDISVVHLCISLTSSSSSTSHWREALIMGTSDGHGMAGGQDHSQLCASILSVFYPKSLQCLAGKETLSYEFFKTCLGSFGRGMFELQIRVLFDEVSELVSKHLKKWDSSSSESGTFFNTITGGGAAVGGGGADVKP